MPRNYLFFFFVFFWSKNIFVVFMGASSPVSTREIFCTMSFKGWWLPSPQIFIIKHLILMILVLYSMSYFSPVSFCLTLPSSFLIKVFFPYYQEEHKNMTLLQTLQYRRDVVLSQAVGVSKMVSPVEIQVRLKKSIVRLKAAACVCFSMRI